MTEQFMWVATCENDDCDWERYTEGSDRVRVQEESSLKMAAHYLNTGHHQTYHEQKE